MIQVLFDTDVLLDVVEDRHPHADSSGAALRLAELGTIEGLVALHSLPTVFYLVEKHRNRHAAYEALEILLRFLRMTSLEHDGVVQALAWRWRDFEDALQAASALRAEADVLVTRNVGDYRNATLAVEKPRQFLARFV